MRTPCQTPPELNAISKSGALGIVSSRSQGMTDVTEDWQTQSLSLKNTSMGIRKQEIIE